MDSGNDRHHPPSPSPPSEKLPATKKEICPGNEEQTLPPKKIFPGFYNSEWPRLPMDDDNPFRFDTDLVDGERVELVHYSPLFSAPGKYSVRSVTEKVPEEGIPLSPLKNRRVNPAAHAQTPSVLQVARARTPSELQLQDYHRLVQAEFKRKAKESHKGQDNKVGYKYENKDKVGTCSQIGYKLIKNLQEEEGVTVSIVEFEDQDDNPFVNQNQQRADLQTTQHYGLMIQYPNL